MRALPESTLSIPILIKFNTGSSGSGFNIRTDDSLYFVTAKHVLANDVIFSTRRYSFCRKIVEQLTIRPF